MKKKARVIAWYLPQFHPIPENDETWGKGFTEWNNVAAAKPLFKGHYQPRLPADLGFYDLRIPEVRKAQADMAKNAGVEGFMYWHYWFGNGKMLLEKPLEWVLKSSEPNFPFCFGWANHSWSTKTWKKGALLDKPKMIAEMQYLGKDDNRKHFEYCLPFFKDSRYIRVDNKLLFVIFSPFDFIGLKDFIDQWNLWAKEEGLEGFYFMGISKGKNSSYEEVLKTGVDGVINNWRYGAEMKTMGSYLKKRIRDVLSGRFEAVVSTYDYESLMANFKSDDNYKENCFPVITPGYDRTPRAGKNAIVYNDVTPEKFQKHVHETLDYVSNKKMEHKIIFLDSWNEWGEGNYMEPDQKYGHGFLEALKREIVEE